MTMRYVVRPRGYGFGADAGATDSEAWRNKFSTQPVPEREFQRLSDSAPRLTADSMRDIFTGADPYAFVPKEDRRVIDELARGRAKDTGRTLEEVQKEYGVAVYLSNVGPLRGLSVSKCLDLAEETCGRLLEHEGDTPAETLPTYYGGMAGRKTNNTLRYFDHLKKLYAAEPPGGLERLGNAAVAGAQKAAAAVYKPVAGAVALGANAANVLGAIDDETADGILEGFAREVSGNDQWLAQKQEGYVTDSEWYKHWDGFASNLALTVLSEAPTQAYRTALAMFTGPLASGLEAGAESAAGKYADLRAEGKNEEMGSGKTAVNVLSSAAINGGLQWMAGEWAVGRLFGPGKATVRSAFRESIRHIVKGFPVEAGQEGAEQLLENFTDICTGVHGDPALLTGEERLAILLQGVPESALVGGALGGLTGSMTAGRVYRGQKLVNEAIPYARNIKEALTRAANLSEDERAVLAHANRILDGAKTCDMGVELARMEERKRNIIGQFAWEMKRADDYAFADPEGVYGQDADPVEVGTREWLSSLARRSDLTDRGVRARMDMEARMAAARLLAKLPHDPEETFAAAAAFAKRAGAPEGFRVDVAQGDVSWNTIPAEVRAFATENGGGVTVPRWAPLDNGVWINANLVAPSQVPTIMLSQSLMERGLRDVLGAQYGDVMLKAYAALEDDPEMRKIAGGMLGDSAVPGAGMADADRVDAAVRWMIDATAEGKKAPGAIRKAVQAFRQAIGRSPFAGAVLSDQEVLTLAGRALDKARNGEGDATVRELVDGFNEMELAEVDKMAQAAGVNWRRATDGEYAAAVDEAATRLGMTAGEFQKTRGVNGWFRGEDGAVVLSPGADHLSAFLHEMLHWLADSRPEHYRAVSAAVMEEAGRSATEAALLTDEGQEAVADEFSREMRDADAARRMLARLDGDRNSALAIRDFLKEAVRRLSGDAFVDVRGNLERLVRWMGNATTRARGGQGVRFSTKNLDYANKGLGQRRIQRLESFYSREQIDAMIAMLKPVVEEIAAPDFFEGNGSYWKFKRENGRAKAEYDRVANLVQHALAQQGVRVDSGDLAADLATQAYFTRQEDLRQVAIRRIAAFLESDSNEEQSWLDEEMERALRPVYFAERSQKRRPKRIHDFVVATWGENAEPVLKGAVNVAQLRLQNAEQAARPTRYKQNIIYKDAIREMYRGTKFFDLLVNTINWKFVPLPTFRGQEFSGDFIDNTWIRFSGKIMSKKLPDGLKAKMKEALERTQKTSYDVTRLESYLDQQEQEEFFELFNHRTIESKGREALEFLRESGRLHDIELEDTVKIDADADTLEDIFQNAPMFQRWHELTVEDVDEMYQDLRENGLNLLFFAVTDNPETKTPVDKVINGDGFTWWKLDDAVKETLGGTGYAQPLLYWALRSCIRNGFARTPKALDYLRNAVEAMNDAELEAGTELHGAIENEWTEADWEAFDFAVLDKTVNQDLQTLPPEVVGPELEKALNENAKLEGDLSELRHFYDMNAARAKHMEEVYEKNAVGWVKTELRMQKEIEDLRQEYAAFKKETGEASQAKMDALQKELDKKTRAYDRLKKSNAIRRKNNFKELKALRKRLRDQARDVLPEQEVKNIGELAAKVTKNMPDYFAKTFIQNAIRLAKTPNTQSVEHPHGARTEGFDRLMGMAREELQKQAAQQTVEQMRALANKNRTASTRKGILASRISPEAQTRIDFAANALELGAYASRLAIDRGVELMQRLESGEGQGESVQFMGKNVGRGELSWMLHALEIFGEAPEKHAAEGWQELNSLVVDGRNQFEEDRAARSAKVAADANEVKERIQGTRDVDRSVANKEDDGRSLFDSLDTTTLKNDFLRLNRDEEIETDFGRGNWLTRAWRTINEGEYDLSSRNLKLREDTHEFLKQLSGGTRSGYARFVADAGTELDTGVDVPVYETRIGGKEDPNAYYVRGRRPSVKSLVDVDAARAALVEYEAKGAAEVRTDDGAVQMDDFNAAFLRRQLADHDAKLALDLELSPDVAENELLNREINEDRERGKLTMRMPMDTGENPGTARLKCSKLQALQVLLSWDQPDVRTIMEWNGWTESNMRQLREFCGEKILTFGDWMRDRLAESRKELDREVVKRFGAHMPHVENYFPTRYSRQAQAGLAPARQAGQAKSPDTGFLISRRFHTLNLDVTKDAFTVFMDTVQGQNRFIAMANRMADIKNVLMRPDVKDAIRTQYGAKFLADFTKKLAAVDGGGIVVETNGILSRICSPFVLNALGFNMSSFMKQALSGFGYLNWGGVSTGGFMRAFWSVASMAPEYRAFLKDATASDYYQNRIKSGGHAAQRFVSGTPAESIMAHGVADALSKASMKPVQWGDSAAALGPGGFAVYQDTRLRVLDECIQRELDAAREEAANGGRSLSRAEELDARVRGEEAAKREALVQWQMATDQTQQSPYVKDKSLGLQSTIGRLYGLFMQNPMQILDLYAQGLRTAWKTGDKAKLTRLLVVNHLVLPTLMLFVSDLFRYGLNPEKWEEATLSKYLTGWLLGPFTGAMIVGDALEGTLSSVLALVLKEKGGTARNGTFVQSTKDELARIWNTLASDAPLADKAAAAGNVASVCASVAPLVSSNPVVTSAADSLQKLLSVGSAAHRQGKRLLRVAGAEDDKEVDQEERMFEIMRTGH